MDVVANDEGTNSEDKRPIKQKCQHIMPITKGEP